MLILILYFFGFSNLSLNDKIDNASNINGTLSQIVELKKLIKLAQKHPDTLGYIYYKIGFRYTDVEVYNLDSSIYFFELAEKYLTIKDINEKLAFAKIYLSECYGKAGDRPQQITKLIESFKISNTDNVDYILQQTDELLGLYNSVQSILNLLELHNVLLKYKITSGNEVDSEIIRIYLRNNLRLAKFFERTNIKESINKLNNNVALFNNPNLKDLKLTAKNELANSYNNLGTYFLQANKPDLSLDQYNKAIKLISNLNELYPTVLYNKAKNLIVLKKFELAYSSILHSQEVLENNFPDNQLYLAYLNGIRSQYYIAVNKFEKSIQSFKSCELNLINVLNSSAKELYRESYRLGVDLDLILTIQKTKLKIYSSNKIAYKTELKKTIHSIDEIIEGVLAHQTEEASKLIFKDYVKTFYQQCINLMIELDEKDLALYYLEKSKSALLMDNFENKSNEKLLVDFHYKVKELTSKPTFDSVAFKNSYDYLPKILELVKQKLDTKSNEPANDYYTTSAINYKSSKPDHTFISYFVTDNKLYVFKVANKIELISWTINSNLESFVNEYASNITHKKDLCLSYILYEALIKPLGKLPKNVTIIPHSYLAKLPFETLTTEPILDEKKLKNAKYLIYHHTIDYQYSLGMLSVMKHKKSTKKQCHLYLPDFGYINEITSNSRDQQLSPLLFAKKEVEEIEKFIPSKIFADKNANKENFINSLSQSSLLHFSGHAIINAEDHNLSYLAFDNTVKNRLYLKDLMGNNSNADLVVLSACETGYGKEGAGEGLLSLGRALVACGTKSIVTSLWNVNDQTGMKIMSSFYKHLKDGNTKSNALRSSKLEFLNSSSSNTSLHPYYWSAFIFIGDEEALKFETANYIIYYSIGLLLLLTLCITYFFKRRKRNFN